MIHASLGYLWMLLIGTPPLQAGEAILDLTSFQQPTEAKTRGWGAGVVIGSPGPSSEPTDPFGVSVILDSKSYHVGDPLSYSVVLRNRYTEDLIIPWQPDWRVVERGHESPPRGYCAASIILTISLERAEATLHLVSIYGSELVEGSRHTLRPGETVRIIGRGKWASEVVSPLLDSFGDSQATVQVRASLQYTYPPDARFSYRPWRSSESVPIRLQLAPK